MVVADAVEWDLAYLLRLIDLMAQSFLLYAAACYCLLALAEIRSRRLLLSVVYVAHEQPVHLLETDGWSPSLGRIPFLSAVEEMGSMRSGDF